jgi:8-oxo-dGTP diphosphatase
VSLIKKLYVVGFLFDRDGTKVVLIRKNRPEWQKGRLNGVGGKVEPMESLAHAMAREFNEEAGVMINSWEHFAVMNGPDWIVDVYRAFNSEALAAAKTQTDENIVVAEVNKLQERDDVIGNLKWLIPLALNSRGVDLPVQFRYLT